MRDMRCQVLMAGAMRPDSAGLKSISAKHLALSSQSLGMFLALMPHIKARRPPRRTSRIAQRPLLTSSHRCRVCRFQAVLAAYVPEAQRTLLKEMDSAVRRLRAQTLDEQTHRPSSLLLTPLG